jgi:hypothetical protein
VPDDVDLALDALYAGPPAEFVAGRDRVAADLRRAGDGARAAAVKALRRPTVAAGALNRVALEQPAIVAEFIDTSDGLRRLQEAGDDPAALRDAITAHRAARRALLDAADAMLSEGGAAPAALDEIAATLDAAALDDPLAAAVTAGRLEKAGGSASAFSTLQPNPDAPKPQPSPRRRPEPPTRAPRPARDPADAREQRRQAARDARILAAASRVDEARRDVDTAEAALAEAGAELRAARRAVDDAQRAHDAAARSLDRARVAEERARVAYDRI